MKPKKRSPIWPYLGILACLFVLSVTAPRAWDRMARHASLERVLESRKAKAVESKPAPQPLETVDESELTARETVRAGAARGTRGCRSPGSASRP